MAASNVPPNRGVYRGGAEERIDVSVRIQCIQDQGELLNLAPPDARRLTDRRVRERRVDLNTLEQQQQQQQQQQ
jgi:hypothetical protein